MIDATSVQLIVLTCTTVKNCRGRWGRPSRPTWRLPRVRATFDFDDGEDRVTTQVVGVFANRDDAEHAADEYGADYRDEHEEELPDNAFTYHVVHDVGTPAGRVFMP